MNPNVKKDNFYFMKLKKQVSKAGKTYYTGKFAYAIDLLGFEKEDGSITLFMAPQDMDKLKSQQGSSQQAPRKEYTQKPPGNPYPAPPRQQEYSQSTSNDIPWPDDEF